MIFADKLINLRKKAGFSQEELADKLDVSRQAVSKWEGAQSVPDLNKIIKLSEIFGVTTDYLLKDDNEKEEFTGTDEKTLRQVSIQEADEYLAVKRKTARLIALGVMLCVMSPICLLILLGLASDGITGENIALAGGMTALLVLVAAATGLFIYSGGLTKKYEFLQTENFDTVYGVSSKVKEEKEKYFKTLVRNNIAGTVMCILGVVPVFFAAGSEKEIMMLSAVSLLLFFIAGGVYLFTSTGIISGAFETLLEEGDYTRKNKETQPVRNTVTAVFWLVMTAAYLLYSFVTMNWDRSWIIWPVSGVLFPIVIMIANFFIKRKH